MVVIDSTARLRVVVVAWSARLLITRPLRVQRRLVVWLALAHLIRSPSARIDAWFLLAAYLDVMQLHLELGSS